MTLYKWSQTASADATADSTINWAEGQAPSSVNDSARAMMAATAKYRDDIAGAIVTTGTSAAYSVSSYQGFDTLADLNGQMIALTPHATNAATVTLNVDSLGAKPLRTSPGTELAAGTIIQGTPYAVVYSSSDGVFYLQGFYGNPYNVPIGAGMDYWGTATPNSSFAFPFGQAISRTNYATLFSLLGTTWGVGDGSTTFNLPDKRGRLSVVNDALGGAAASRVTNAIAGFAGDTLGGAGGSQSHTLTLNELPSGITSNGSSSVTVTSTRSDIVVAGSAGFFGNNQGGSGGGISFNPAPPSPSAVNSTGSGPASVTSTNTGGAAHPIMPPAIVCNYIIRII